MDSATATSCFHCDQPIPAGSDWAVEIHGRSRPVCCPACRSVGQSIVDSGLAGYYERRTSPAPRPLSGAAGDRDAIKPPVDRYISEARDGTRAASLIIHDIHCAACIWLIEERLSKLPGVSSALLNYTTHRLAVEWDPAEVDLDAIVTELNRIGYRATPYDESLNETFILAARREQLTRIGVAGVLGMQVMMLATALYFGDARGMDAGLRALFTWASLLLCIPILLYSAQPFFRGALRDIRNRRVGMDVPVSLGISIAFLGSAAATVTGHGSVFYESVAMFVFFLLVARHYQQTSLQRNAIRIESLGKVMTESAVKLGPGRNQTEVAAGVLRPGDLVLVRSGCTIPADGRVVSGTSTVDESLVSGEARPVLKGMDDEVLAGSVNLEQPLDIRVSCETGQNTVSQIMRLVERAMASRPYATVIADRIAGKFIVAVLALAAGAALYWYRAAPEMWLPVTISVLVVTCPCALSLAAPTAFTAAIHSLGRRGVATLRADAVADLGNVDHVIFDKTGTLTESRLRISNVVTMEGFTRQEVLGLASSLEAYAHHPIARALQNELPSAAEVRNLQVKPGEGLQGDIDGKTWFVGNSDYIRQNTMATCPEEPGVMYAMLADSEFVRATIYFESGLRKDAKTLIADLQGSGTGVSLLSGDTSDAVSRVAASAGIKDWVAGLSPQEKMDRARHQQEQGKTVAMIGDGINDAPVLAVSNVSIAMAEGASMAHTQSDFVLLNNRLDALVAAMRIARKCSIVLRQNLGWAIFYNALAVPAAVIGMVPPWLATIGMSASSLLVVANSLRIDRDAAGETARAG